MANLHSNVIAFPRDLIVATEQYAVEAKMSVSQVAETALRLFIEAETELNSLRKHHQTEAASMGLTADEYVTHMVKASREGKTRRSA